MDLFGEDSAQAKRESGWYPYEKLGNINVPRGVEILGTQVSDGGELFVTYYMDKDAGWKVGSEKGELPDEIEPYVLRRVMKKNAPHKKPDPKTDIPKSRAVVALYEDLKRMCDRASGHEKLCVWDIAVGFALARAGRAREAELFGLLPGGYEVTEACEEDIRWLQKALMDIWELGSMELTALYGLIEKDEDMHRFDEEEEDEKPDTKRRT
jgi:hypothetical protein